MEALDHQASNHHHTHQVVVPEDSVLVVVLVALMLLLPLSIVPIQTRMEDSMLVNSANSSKVVYNKRFPPFCLHIPFLLPN